MRADDRFLPKRKMFMMTKSEQAERNRMDVHLIDGTYELFRHFYAVPASADVNGQEVGAVRGVLTSVLSMIERGATHLGVATDHVVESFRNDLYPGYKTSEGVAPELLSQFPILEDALQAMGVVVWPMVEFEADDALASAAAKSAKDDRLGRVLICTPDKDLSQCVVGSRVVQLDRRRDILRDEAGVVDKFGVRPLSIPDYLAVVGDSADGFPDVAAWGQKAAALTLSISIPSFGRHSERLASVASLDSKGPPAVRIAIQRLERCPVVSHTGDSSTGCSRLRHGGRSSMAGTAR
jgi:5'-3' exonuclease